ncbi:MAG TPA: DNA mismatch endonuclease Vsr [Thermoanaerobaculia bacterium]
MADVHNKEQRSRNMAAIRDRDTKPEMIVRRLVHRLGYRFRLHRRNLPGRPDLVLPRHRAVIFVHGCFWHQHDCRYGRVVPATRAEFWQKKRGDNVSRDARNLRALKDSGWRVLIVWECWTRDTAELSSQVKLFMHAIRR